MEQKTTADYLLEAALQDLKANWTERWESALADDEELEPFDNEDDYTDL